VVSIWRIGLAVLAIVDGIFHFLLKGNGPLSTTGIYFLLSGVLLIVGALLVLLQGSGALFALGAYGLIAIAIIDNALLYLTRTYGLRFLSSVMGRGGGFHPGGNFTGIGNFTRPGNFTGNFTRPPGFNGTFTGGFGGRSIPWSTSWIPPGAVQTFVLQILIIVVAIAAVVTVHRMRKGTAAPPSPASPSPPAPTSGSS
jgi:hypothetical protein